MRYRQGLQKRIKAMHTKHKDDRKIMIHDLVQYIRRQKNEVRDQSRQRMRSRSKEIGCRL